MKNVKKLIDISERINCQGDYQKFFSFAGNYITKMKQEKRDNTEIFFNMVKTCENKYNTINVKLSMGISGAGNNIIKPWCKEILGNKELKSLTLDEIHYIMAVCAIKSKIKKESKEITENKNNKMNTNEMNKIIKQANYVIEKDTVTQTCKKCKKSFEVEKSKPFPKRKDGICPYCNYKHSIVC